MKSKNELIMINEKRSNMKCEKQSLYYPLPPVSVLFYKMEMATSTGFLLEGRRLGPETCEKLWIEPEEYKLTKTQKELRLKQPVKKLAGCLKIS